MAQEEINPTDYVGEYVEYAGSNFMCVGVVNMFGVWFVEILDEPPTEHIDRVKLSSVKLTPTK